MRARRAWVLASIAVVACDDTFVAEAPPTCEVGEELGPDGRCLPVLESCAPGLELVAGACIGPVCSPGEYVADDGTCTAAGLRLDRACEPGERDTRGGCVEAGVPADGCGVGFVHDGDGGCVPILPSERCPFGSLAIPGDAACRPVDDCGTDTWGNIVVDSETQFVDSSFVGISDGSQAAPWTLINDAYAAATPGAIVAVAAGRYVESVFVDNKPVELRGRCASLVTIAAPNLTDGPNDVYDFAILVRNGAHGSQVHGVTLTLDDGAFGTALAVGNTTGVVVEHVHVYGADIGTFLVASSGFDADLVVRDSLLEANDTNAGLVSGALTIERSMLRNASFFGVGATPGPTAEAARLTLRSSVVEDNLAAGFACIPCVGRIEDSVLRGTRSIGDASYQDGQGIVATPLGQAEPFGDYGTMSDLTIVRSFVSDNVTSGIAIQGGTALIENTVVEDTGESATVVSGPAETQAGHGINITSVPLPDGRPADVVVRGSLVKNNIATGINTGGSSVLLDGVIVRDTRPTQTGALPGILGIGVHVLPADGQEESSRLTVVGSVVERNANAGIAAFDSPLTVTDTVVRDTFEDAQRVGYGILAATEKNPLVPITVEGTRCENNKGVGILLLGVDATVTATEIRGTKVNSLGVGYALGVQTNVPNGAPTPSNAWLRGLLIEDNEDAGIAVFGSTVRVEGAVIRDTVPSASGDFGDALQLQSHRKKRAEATLVSVLTERSSRAAISSFGATVYVEAATLACQTFDLSVEDLDDFAQTLELGEFNVCGCDEQVTCKVESAGLTPLLPVE